MVDAGLGIFGTLVQNLNALGFYGFVLPWLLIFAVVYGILVAGKIFGGDKKIAGLIALVIAFFVTAYTGIGSFFIGMSGLGAMLFGSLLIVVMFFALLGFQIENFKDVFKGWEGIIFLAVLGLVVFFVIGGGVISGITLSSEVWGAILMIVIIALAIMFVAGGGEKK